MKELSAGERITGDHTSAALGIFDGVHRGHRAVIGQAVKNAAENGYIPVVCTFKTATVNTKGESYKPIYSDSTKCALLEREGAQYVYMPDFSQIRDMSAEDFAKNILMDKLSAKTVVCGRDFRFGKNAACGVNELAKICKELDMELIIAEDVSEKGEKISSAQIRRLIAEGNISVANRLLGHHYAVTGEVIKGNQIGRTMDFPTANQRLDGGFVLPRFGVYASYAELDGITYRGITNIGVKPTVESDGTVLAETHFPFYSGDLYGKNITVRIMGFVRPERKFGSVDELKKQIAEDLRSVC